MKGMPAKVKPYFGYNPKVDDEWTRIGFQRSRDGTAHYYGKPTESDVQVFGGQVVLNEVTADYLYSKFTPTKMKIRKGEYPKLDRVVERLIGDGGELTDRMKVLKLLLWCRDIPIRGRKTKCYYAGGPEESVAFQGGDMCNEMNRVFMVLCQIAGFASRYVGHFSSVKPNKTLTTMPGHGVAEVYLEGGWAYFDIRGKHFVWPNGRLASLCDLVRNPDLYVNQPQEVRMLHDQRRNVWSSGQRLVMWPSLQVISNYDAAVRRKSTYSRIKITPAREKEYAKFIRERTKQCQKELRELLSSGYKFTHRSPW